MLTVAIKEGSTGLKVVIPFTTRTVSGDSIARQSLAIISTTVTGLGIRITMMVLY